MGLRTLFSVEQKLKIVTFYLSLPSQERRYAITTEKFKCSQGSLKLWIRQYLDYGKKGLKPKKHAKYSQKFKQSIVKLILSREVTKSFIARKYKISRASLNNWIDKFNYIESQGLESRARGRGTQYSIEDMVNAVQYMKEEANVTHVSRTLNISVPTLNKWYKLYSEDGIKALNHLYLNSLTMTKSKPKSQTKIDTSSKEVQAPVAEEKASTENNSNKTIKLTGDETQEELLLLVKELQKKARKAEQKAIKAEQKAQQKEVEALALKKLCTLLKII